MMIGKVGLQGAFIKKEKSGLSVHFTTRVQDKDGSGSDLLQYSYVSMKSDLVYFLKETGRLPTSTIQENFEEIKEFNLLKDENEAQRTRITDLEHKINKLTGSN